MVLESLISAAAARKHPIDLLIYSFILSSIGLWVSFFVFPESASILALAFVTIALMPIIHGIFVQEEEKELEHPGASISFLKRHFNLIKIYSWFFIGLIISYSFWYTVLPETADYKGESNICFDTACIAAPTKESVFKEQETTYDRITNLRSNVATGKITQQEQDFVFWNLFNLIFTNNATVLGLAVLLSFIYGAGALFLLGWNASVIGLFIGKEILSKNLEAGLILALGFVPHGMPELIAYFIGAIAGGIISVAITRKKFKTREFETIAKDALVLLFIAYAILFIAAWIEAVIILG